MDPCDIHGMAVKRSGNVFPGAALFATASWDLNRDPRGNYGSPSGHRVSERDSGASEPLAHQVGRGASRHSLSRS